MRLCLRTQHGGGSYRTPTSRFGVRDSTPTPPRPLEYMLTCGTKGHYILPLSDLSKMVIVMTRIPPHDSWNCASTRKFVVLLFD